MGGSVWTLHGTYMHGTWTVHGTCMPPAWQWVNHAWHVHEAYKICMFHSRWACKVVSLSVLNLSRYHQGFLDDLWCLLEDPLLTHTRNLWGSCKKSLQDLAQYLVGLDHVLVYWPKEEFVTVLSSSKKITMDPSGVLATGSKCSVRLGKANYCGTVAAVGRYVSTGYML